MKNNDLTTLHKIMSEGKIEFLQKGFKDASLRNIVKNAGLTTGAFYGYFKDKQALFEALVSPVVEGLKELFMESQVEFDKCSKEFKTENVYDYSSEAGARFVDYIYDNFEEFKLLVCCADGTEFEEFIHDIVDVEVEYTFKFINSTNNDAVISGRITPDLIHIVSSAFFTAIFETVKHDMPKEEAKRYTKNLRAFFTAGWKELLRI